MSTLAVLAAALLAVVSPEGNLDHGLAHGSIGAPVDSPAGWTPDTLLSPPDDRESREPRIAIDDLDRLHVVWKDNRRIQGRDEIHYLMKDSTGWTDFMSVGRLDTAHNSPDVAVDAARNVHVTFLRWYGVPYDYYDVGYRMRDGATGNWDDEERLTTDDSLQSSADPQVVVNGDTVFVFWMRTRITPREVGYIYNNGSGWSQRVAVTKQDAAPLRYDVEVTGDGWLHVVWQDNRNDTNQVYHRYFDGDSWSTPELATRHGYYCTQPGIATDSAGDVHLVFGGGPSPEGRLHYNRWSRATRTWGTPTRWYSWSGAPDPRIAVNQATGERHLSHVGYTTGWVLAYKRYDPTQQVWTDSTQLTFYNVPLGAGEMVLDAAGYVHMVFWSSHAGSQEEIVYKTNRLPTGLAGQAPGRRIGAALVRPSVAAGRLRLAGVKPVALYTGDGRRAAELSPGDNDVSRLDAGVYFVRLSGGGSQKIVIER